MTRTRILLGVSSVAILMAAKAEAGTLWVANMNQAQEVPPTGVPYTGTGFLILNDAESSAVVTATHNIPAAIVTGGHIHRGPVGVNGPIILPFPNNGVSPVGPLTWAIPSAEVVNLKADGLYMNIHTQQFPAGAIRGQIVPSLLATSATNAPQLAVANALDVSAGFTPDLDLVLMSAAVASAGTNAQLLDDLSAGTVYVQGRHAVETMASFQETLFSLTEDLAGSSAQGFGLFATAGDSFGKRDAVIGQPRSKISRPWVLAGVDFGSGAGVRGGLGVGYAKGKDKVRGGFGKTDVETTSVQAFVSTGQKVVVSAVAGYGWNKFDTQRNIASLGRTASSSHDGKVWALGAKVSAPLTLNSNLNISPYGQVDMQHARIKAYSETGAGSVGLVV
ncbi:MAG: autotransporter outer rane beta-barrel protein, partial [Caulobacteraceae bacterium]|nr:autotransporter outer rane beta-barrel protein [Caulobacteraceae bacterium]